jgi:hypothetical protein
MLEQVAEEVREHTAIARCEESTEKRTHWPVGHVEVRFLSRRKKSNGRFC